MSHVIDTTTADHQHNLEIQLPSQSKPSAGKSMIHHRMLICTVEEPAASVQPATPHEPITDPEAPDLLYKMHHQ